MLASGLCTFYHHACDGQALKHSTSTTCQPHVPLLMYSTAVTVTRLLSIRTSTSLGSCSTPRSLTQVPACHFPLFSLPPYFLITQLLTCVYKLSLYFTYKAHTINGALAAVGTLAFKPFPISGHAHIAVCSCDWSSWIRISTVLMRHATHAFRALSFMRARLLPSPLYLHLPLIVPGFSASRMPAKR